MSKTFLGRLIDFGRGARSAPAGSSSGEIVNRITKHLALAGEPLMSLRAQVGLYVVTGENSSVLSSIATRAVRNAWRDRNRNISPEKRGVLFAPGVEWTTAQMRRLGEVLATLEPPRGHSDCFGTEKSPEWLRCVVTEWLEGERNEQSPDRLAAIADEYGLGTLIVLDMLLCRGLGWHHSSVDKFGDVGGWLATNAGAVANALGDLGADQRANFAVAIGRFDLVGCYLEPLVDLACGSSKKVRIAARRALTGAESGVLRDSLVARYRKASPALRAALVEVAAAALGERAHYVLAAWKAKEASTRPLTAIERAMGTSITGKAGQPDARMDGPAGYRAVDGSFVELPLRPPDPEASAIPAECVKLLEPAAAAFNAAVAAIRAKAEVEADWQTLKWIAHYPPIRALELKALKDLGESDGPDLNLAAIRWIEFGDDPYPGTRAFFDDDRLSLWHSVRFAVASRGGYFESIFKEKPHLPGAALARRVAEGADIRVVLDLWIRFGGHDPVFRHLTANWYGVPFEVDAPLWLTLSKRFDMLDEAMGLKPQSGASTLSMRPALDLLALFPKLPLRYLQPLMMVASGTVMEARNVARALLRGAPDIDDAIARLLDDGRQEMRAGAAEWLMQRNAYCKIAVLRSRLRKERSEVARAALTTALERLGDDVSDLFDSDAIVLEAETGLAKTKVAALEWFPIDHLPSLKWRDGVAVDPRLPRWWVTLAAKLKRPGGTALFDLWLDRLAPGDAHRLGWMVLVSWIEQDTRTCTVDEANAYAAANVDSVAKRHRLLVQHYPEMAASSPTDHDSVFEFLRRTRLATCLGSATDSKGILALCTRVNGPDAAQRVSAFLKDHGWRVAQAKALLDMLASNPSSAALQVVLAAANRSKQRTIQAHAGALVEAIAARRGWTAEELADRTVPTAGLDVEGRLELDCGRGRLYSLRLDETDTLALFNTEGKQVKTLPGPGIDEEKPVIEAAKKLVLMARKQSKQVLVTQGRRLREAMCFGRQWKVADWESFIARHPIVGRLAKRLIWLEVGLDGDVLASFRPLGDGSNTDATDRPVDLAVFSQVQLAHRSLLDSEAIGAWQRHTADYEVVSPFDQIGRDLPVLAAAQRAERAVRDREGWMIETFKLRGIAAKLGYSRSAAGDGGWFSSYERPYRGAGIVAELEFTGSPLPEQNVPVALVALGFHRLRDNGHQGQKIALGEVPPVLLAECWQDLHDIAAKGSGFDPDWQKKAHE